MNKSLNKEKKKDELVDNVSYDTQEIKNEQDKAILEALRQCMERDKVYLNPSLSIQDLSQMIGTNKTKLSHVINTYLHQNFATLINKYRIVEAIKLLSDDQYLKNKIEVIGEMCGYSNRQVFHAAFKKEMGITPTHFRNINKNNAKKNKGEKEELFSLILINNLS